MRRSFIFILIFVNYSTLTSLAFGTRDSTKIKKVEYFGSMKSQFSMYPAYFNHALVLINQDKLELGIEQLNQGIYILNKETYILQTCDYYFLEFSSIVEFLASGAAQKHEVELGHIFIKKLLKNDLTDLLATTNRYLKVNPNSVFINRVKFYLSRSRS